MLEFLGLKDKAFCRFFLTVAIPVIIQNLVGSLMHIVDTVMIGRLGEVELAGVGLANQYSFMAQVFVFGMISGISIFISQYWGARDIKSIYRMNTLLLALATAVTVPLVLLPMIFPQGVLKLFSDDAAVIESGAVYIRTVAPSFLLSAWSFAYGGILRSTEQARLPMAGSVAGLLLNTFLNYLFIFGHLGFPAMGIRGAAVATVIGSALSLMIIAVGAYRIGSVAAMKPKDFRFPSKKVLRGAVGVILPVICNEVIWSLGDTMYTVAYGHMGVQAAAVMNVYRSVERLMFVASNGTANSAVVLVGKSIGEGDEEKGYLYARRLLFLALTAGALIGVSVLFLRGPISMGFKISEDSRLVLRQVLSIGCVLMAVKFFNSTNIVGVLRSGGDTRFAMLLDTGGMWLISVPLVFLAGLVWKLPLPKVYALIMIEEVYKLTLGMKRFFSRKWLRNVIGTK